MKQKVVIIGHGYTSRLGLIRSLGAVGCEVTVVVMVFHGRWGRFIRFDGGKPIDCHSKYVHRMFYCQGQGRDEEGLIRLLLDRCTDDQQKVVIIPDSDFSAAVIDKNQERLKDHFLFPHIHHEPGAVEHWMHKTVQKQLAKEVGLNVTRDCTIVVKDGHYSMPEQVQYPCFTKPLATISGGKQFLCRCNGEEELRKVLDGVALRFPNTEVLVEDFKQIDTEYAVVGFSDGENVVIPGVIEFIVNSKSHFGIAREGKIMPVTGFESILEQFKAFVRQMGFCGLFDVDFYFSEGKMYFGEMNLRFGGSGYAYTASGVNLPAMCVAALTGNSWQALPNEVRAVSTYVNERMCVDDWSFYHIDETEMRRIMGEADIHFVADSDDLGPQRKLECYMKQQRVKRVLRKWLRR